MKILHVTKKFPPLIGGDASVVSNLVKIQSKKNSVFVLTSNCGQTKSKNILKFGMKAKSKDLDNISIKRIMSLFLLFIKSFYILKKIQPKIIHVHSIDLAFAISLSSKLLNIPLICTLHGTTFNKKEINYFKRILDKMLIRFSLIDKISVVDKTSLINFSTNHVKYVPNGIDTSLFKPIKNKIKNKKQIKLLSVGRLEKIKGFDLLVDVVNKHEEFTLTLVGDGPIKRKLIKKAKRKIFFKGEIKNKNLPGIYQSHEVFILPSLIEGFPVVVLEAMACGIPCIITNVGNNKIVFKNENDCLMIKPNNLNDLENALEKIKSKKLRAKLGKNARRKAEMFDWEIISKRYQNIYSKILKNN